MNYFADQQAVIKEALSKIETIILDAAKEDEGAATGLLNVLSALRGPDTGEPDAKYYGTNHVRWAAFPNITTDDPFTTPWDTRRSWPPNHEKSSSHHFNVHVRLAFEALDIKEE